MRERKSVVEEMLQKARREFHKKVELGRYLESLQGAELCREDAEKISFFLSNSKLIISFSANGLSLNQDSLFLLSKSLPFSSSLTTLELTENVLAEDSLKHLCFSLKYNKSVKSLLLSNNKIGPEGAAHLAECLKYNCCITQLDLKRNLLGDKGGEKISEMIRKNDSLKVLNLRSNAIGESGGKCIAHELHFNNTLLQLTIFCSNFLETNCMSEKTAKRISNYVSENSSNPERALLRVVVSFFVEEFFGGQKSDPRVRRIVCGKLPKVERTPLEEFFCPKERESLHSWIPPRLWNAKWIGLFPELRNKFERKKQRDSRRQLNQLLSRLLSREKAHVLEREGYIRNERQMAHKQRCMKEKIVSLANILEFNVLRVDQENKEEGFEILEENINEKFFCAKEGCHQLLLKAHLCSKGCLQCLCSQCKSKCEGEKCLLCGKKTVFIRNEPLEEDVGLLRIKCRVCSEEISFAEFKKHPKTEAEHLSLCPGAHEKGGCSPVQRKKAEAWEHENGCVYALRKRLQDLKRQQSSMLKLHKIVLQKLRQLL